MTFSISEKLGYAGLLPFIAGLFAVVLGYEQGDDDGQAKEVDQDNNEDRQHFLEVELLFGWLFSASHG